MSIVTLLINIAWRLTELSAHIALQLLISLLGIVRNVLSAVTTGRANARKAERRQPLRRRRQRREKRW